MNWTCPHWVDLYTAWVSGICLGLLLGAVVTQWVIRKVDIRTLNEWSQK